MRLYEKAFTLIEVALAIAILGIGLATITTLSTRLVDDTFYEVGRSNGTILALYILETQTASPTDSTKSNDDKNQNQAGSLVTKLEALGFFAGLNKEEDFPYLNANWTYEIKYEPLDLPMTETNFNIVTSIVRWGSNDFETVHLQTIIKAKDKPTTQPSPGQSSGGAGGGAAEEQ